MPESVIDELEISLNGVRYPLARAVQSSLSSQYPPKITTGDTTKASNPVLSTLAFTDHRGGIGLDIMEGAGETDRSWYSTADLRHKGHLTLPPLVTNSGNLPAGLTAIFHLMQYQGDVFANVDATTNGVYKYAVSGDTWGANLLNNSLTNWSGRWALVDVNDKSYLAFGGGGSTYIWFDGTTWDEETVGSVGGFMASWDDRLWVVCGTSPYNLMFSLTPETPGSWTVLSATPMARPLVKTGQLFEARNAAGNPILYLAVPTGLYAYDAANDTWHATGIANLPDSPSINGVTQYTSAVVWRDDIYIGNRSTVFKYSVSGSGAVVTAIGPDQDDGLPSDKGYIIQDMVASLNDLIISVRGGASESRKSLILAWNGLGWRVLYESATDDEELRPLVVARNSGAVEPTAYRLWFANNTTSPYNIAWLPLQSDLVNPLQTAGSTFAAAATHDWPWFTAGQVEVTKVAVRLHVEVKDASANEKVTASYATDFSNAFTGLTAITSDGVTTFDFPNSATPTGTEFRSIRLRVKLERGGTPTLTPDVPSVTLEYYKKLVPKWAHTVEIDLSGNYDGGNTYKGNTVQQMRASLVTAVESGVLVEYTHRDPDANTNATFYVQARGISGLEHTGHDERGRALVTLQEV